MNPESMKSLNVQHQIRRNAEEQASFLKTMGSWEEDIKKRDQEIRERKAAREKELKKKKKAKGPRAGVRISGGTVKAKMTIKEATKEDFEVSKGAADTIKGRAEGSERGVFLGTGVGEAANPANIVVAGSLEKPKGKVPEPAPRRPTDELEGEERARGNDFFKKGDYQAAAKSYTRCLGINSRSGIALSNRAMCHLKMKDWLNAEKDAGRALEIDSTHVKSYQRRSAARLALGKMRGALNDLMEAEKLGGSKGLSVEIRKAKEAMRDAVKRAPKKRIKVEVVEGVSRVGGEVEVLEIGENGFDLEGVKDSREVEKEKEREREKEDAAVEETVDVTKIKPPKTATEFELVWRSLKGQTSRISYLTKVVGSGKSKKYKLSKLYSSGFQDAVVFEGILSALDKCEDGCSEVVGELAKVKNVDMLCMMVEKGMVKRIVEKAYRKGGDIPETVKKNLV